MRLVILLKSRFQGGKDVSRLSIGTKCYAYEQVMKIRFTAILNVSDKLWLLLGIPKANYSQVDNCVHF